MPDELYLPILAAVALLWCLVCSLRQLRCEPLAEPTVVWREATVDGWSDWIELCGVSLAVGYAAVLDRVRQEARAEATAVQFASVVRPWGAPEFTLRVLFMSEVRESTRGRILVSAGGGA